MDLQELMSPTCLARGASSTSELANLALGLASVLQVKILFIHLYLRLQILIFGLQIKQLCRLSISQDIHVEVCLSFKN